MSIIIWSAPLCNWAPNLQASSICKFWPWPNSFQVIRPTSHETALEVDERKKDIYEQQTENEDNFELIIFKTSPFLKGIQTCTFTSPIQISERGRVTHPHLITKSRFSGCTTQESNPEPLVAKKMGVTIGATPVHKPNRHYIVQNATIFYILHLLHSMFLF